jgi:hypothetical protein
MNRVTKTSQALTLIIMDEVGLCEELAEFKGVTILRTDRHHPQAPNWDATFETLRYSGNSRPIPMPIAHPLADEIIRKLQSQYDLC